MVQKTFVADNGYLHIPVRSGTPDEAYYIDVIADGKVRNEFLIGVCAPDETFDYYVALDVTRYNTGEVTLVCRHQGVKETLFDGVIAGGKMQEYPELYPNLYHEEIRQQIHFSPARGWMNDPNGLFYKDGVFHMYFQHNPLSNHHFHTNVSWGHAQTVDGIHFTEHGDAIIPRSSRLHVASGSCVVDEHNISGLGKGTILAAYTDLFSHQYHSRPAVTSGGGQNLLYSLDDGMTFTYFENNPVIPVPDHQKWRDPKILQLDENHLVIAVYETFKEQNCISFYRSSDCRTWTFCSRIMDFFECPDLFKLKVTNAEEEIWVVYGAHGKYHIGYFEDFQFRTVEAGHYIDYGDCVYAGQTFNNYGDGEKRLYTAWLRDSDTDWDFCPDEPNRRYGFAQSMALFTELTVVKTKYGYRLFRAPIAALKELRDTETQGTARGEMPLPAPTETVFTMRADRDMRVDIRGVGFTYTANNGRIHTTSGKEYTTCSEDDLTVRLIADRRSVEIYIQDEIAMSFFVKEKSLRITCDYDLPFTQYVLKSIWDNGRRKRRNYER